jgi:hypothetical protein
MKKVTTKSKHTENDDLRAEYDFSSAVRGKHYKPLHKGYSVHVHQMDGTTVIQHFTLEEGTVMLDPDIREVFPDSEAVNTALRSLITLLRQFPDKNKSGVKRGRITQKQQQPTP